ncbi:MAG: hypothetical protein ACLVIU_00160 [Paraclostridium sp.]
MYSSTIKTKLSNFKQQNSKNNTMALDSALIAKHYGDYLNMCSILFQNKNLDPEWVVCIISSDLFYYQLHIKEK